MNVLDAFADASHIDVLIQAGGWLFAGVALGSMLAGLQRHPGRVLGLVPVGATGLGEVASDRIPAGKTSAGFDLPMSCGSILGGDTLRLGSASTLAVTQMVERLADSAPIKLAGTAYAKE